ncbi:MAG: hypothetical protein LBO04_02945, partial [Spirochaetaceae bacterium]|nr:hypothetical protein [Spirochaetaceae bacterium]
LTKEDLILKLSPYGVKSLTSINRLLREQGLPAKYLTPRKIFFNEAEIDVWLSRRNEGVSKANTTRMKILRAQRKARKDTKKEGEIPQKLGIPLSVEAKPFKKAEA